MWPLSHQTTTDVQGEGCWLKEDPSPNACANTVALLRIADKAVSLITKTIKCEHEAEEGNCGLE